VLRWEAQGTTLTQANNAACAALSVFRKLISSLQGLEPPGRLYVDLDNETNLEWCRTFVQITELEAVIRQYRRAFEDPHSCEACIRGTLVTYEKTNLKQLYIDSLIEDDQATGFHSTPLDAATAERVKSIPLQPEHELEPSIQTKDATSQEGATTHRRTRKSTQTGVLQEPLSLPRQSSQQGLF